MQVESKKLNFEGQHIFIGLDVAKKSWKVCILTKDFEHKLFTQPPRAEVLVHYLQRYFPGAQYHCVYEAGFSGFWTHDQLNYQGVDCIVVNPADVPQKGKEKIQKTDRVDARKLALNLRSGQLEPIFVPPSDQVEDRALVRTRYHFMKKQTRCKNQIKALLYFYGISIPEDVGERYWSRRFIRWLETVSTKRESGTYALKVLLEELLTLRQTILNLNRKIRMLAMEEPYRKSVHNLRTIPGISTLSAMILLTELVDINRFPSLDELSCYFGLVPGEHSSGEKQNITGIIRRRNAFLKALIVESSWIAVRKDPALMQAFEKLSQRMPKNKTIIRIARKLLNRIRYVLKNDRPYQCCVLETET